VKARQVEQVSTGEVHGGQMVVWLYHKQPKHSKSRGWQHISHDNAATRQLSRCNWMELKYNVSRKDEGHVITQHLLNAASQLGKRPRSFPTSIMSHLLYNIALSFIYTDVFITSMHI